MRSVIWVFLAMSLVSACTQNSGSTDDSQSGASDDGQPTIISNNSAVGRPHDEKTEFRLNLRLELGSDIGQGIGTLFKVETDSGWEIGAGFVDSHNTYLRSNNRNLSFYARPM